MKDFNEIAASLPDTATIWVADSQAGTAGTLSPVPDWTATTPESITQAIRALHEVVETRARLIAGGKEPAMNPLLLILADEVATLPEATRTDLRKVLDQGPRVGVTVRDREGRDLVDG